MCGAHAVMKAISHDREMGFIRLHYIYKLYYANSNHDIYLLYHHHWWLVSIDIPNITLASFPFRGGENTVNTNFRCLKNRKKGHCLAHGTPIPETIQDCVHLNYITSMGTVTQCDTPSYTYSRPGVDRIWTCQAKWWYFWKSHILSSSRWSYSYGRYLIWAGTGLVPTNQKFPKVGIN